VVYAPACIRVLAAALAGLAFAQHAQATPSCPAPCTLRDAAALAGVEIGAAVSLSEIRAGSTARTVFTREFSSLTPENAMKWSVVSPTPGSYAFGEADALVELAESAGMRVRGHTLFWGRPNGPPPWLDAEVLNAPDPQARLRELMTQHAGAVAGRYAGRIAQWDVVNEPLSFNAPSLDPNNLFNRVLGEAWIGEAFQLAHAADPNAQLFLNETLLEFSASKFQGFKALVERVLATGAPIDGVGFQAHFFFARPDRVALQAQIQAMADLGLAVELTELDIPIGLFGAESDPLAAQAGAYADVFAACLAVSACRGITTWGVSDGTTWLDDAAFFSNYAPNRPLLFDAQYDPKPAYGAVRDELLSVPEPSSALLLGLGLGALSVIFQISRPQA